MDERIFRKKSLDKIKSPDNLDDYIRVSNPTVWLLLLSVILLLIGACVWGFGGRIDSTIPVSVRLVDGQAMCFISEDNIGSVKSGMTVKFADREALIDSIGEKTDEGYVCSLSGVVSLSDGFYEGTLILKSFVPVSFVFN